MGPPVARSAANPWAPGLENLRGSSPARVEPTAARALPKLELVSSKSLSSECCKREFKVCQEVWGLCQLPGALSSTVSISTCAIGGRVQWETRAE